jgi:hypothetical protein
MKIPLFSAGFLRRPLLLGVVGSLCFGLSIGLVRSGVNDVVTVRQQALPLLAELPTLRNRREILREQLELAELQAALRIGSADELVHAFVLPADDPSQKLQAALDIAANHWQRRGLAGDIANFQAVEGPTTDGLRAVTVDFSIAVTEQGAAILQDFLQLSGALTVADALRPDERDALFARVEADSPTGIIALEQFLTTDLLAYAADPLAHEQALRRAMPQPLFQSQLLAISERSALRAARDLLGGEAGEDLRQAKLWPLPFVTPRQVTLRRGGATGWYQAKVQVELYRRHN